MPIAGVPFSLNRVVADRCGRDVVFLNLRSKMLKALDTNRVTNAAGWLSKMLLRMKIIRDDICMERRRLPPPRPDLWAVLEKLEKGAA